MPVHPKVSLIPGAAPRALMLTIGRKTLLISALVATCLSGICIMTVPAATIALKGLQELFNWAVATMFLCLILPPLMSKRRGCPRNAPSNGSLRTALHSLARGANEAASGSLASASDRAATGVRHNIQPVMPPTFASLDFENQVEELSDQLVPTAACTRSVQAIVQEVKKAIGEVFPDANVFGYANSDICRGTAYGVAVPEVEIVVHISPAILLWTLQKYNSKISFLSSSPDVDHRRLIKSAIRLCADRLMNVGFKFRRSAFRGRDPKVTLMAPSPVSDEFRSIPFDMSVNTVIPLCNSVLITACSLIDPRSRLLILLVRRWAKDRGICQAAKGHLMPYAWTLLSIYFLQVGFKDGSLVPPFENLRLTLGNGGVCISDEPTSFTGLEDCTRDWAKPKPTSAEAEMSLAELFKKFVQFYLEEMDWAKEVVCIRFGMRAVNLKLTHHTLTKEDGTSELGPTIEDPFMHSEHVSETLTYEGLERLKEELGRAKECLQRGASLTELLTQWVPPEKPAQDQGRSRPPPGLEDSCANDAVPPWRTKG